MPVVSTLSDGSINLSAFLIKVLKYFLLVSFLYLMFTLPGYAYQTSD